MTSRAYGEDRSNHQALLPWTGLDFGFAKASEGNSYADPLFAGNWAAMKEAGIRRGAYHYFHPGLDPGEQAALFMSVVAKHGIQPGDMLAVDAEISTGLDGTLRMDPGRSSRSALLQASRTGHAFIRPGVTYHSRRLLRRNMPRKAPGLSVGSAASQFLGHVADAVHTITGGPHCPVLTYSYLDFLPNLAACTAYPLWLASYSTQAPQSAQPWTEWVIWQYSGGGGLGGSDANWWNGTPQDMDRWITTWNHSGTPDWTETLVNSLPLLQQAASTSPRTDVKILQGCLLAWGHALVIDGIFGPATTQAVRTFQTRSGLTPDGIVGPLTWTKLLGR